MIIFNTIADLSEAQLLVDDVVQILGETEIGDRAYMMGIVREGSFVSGNRLIPITQGLKVEIMPELVISSADSTEDEVLARGATARQKLGDRFADMYSIKDFGGVADDSVSNTTALRAILAKDVTFNVPDGYWPNNEDATFNIYPEMRNHSGGLKLKRGVPNKGTANPYPLIWAEKTSNAQRTTGGPKYFDVAMQGALTLEKTATAFGVGVSGFIRSSAGDCTSSSTWVDAIGVHGSGKAIGKDGRVWGFWGQAGTADDGTGIRPSQIIGMELNLVNTHDAQPHHESGLPLGEGAYRGLVVTTADKGKTCGIGIDVGDGSGRTPGESGWWTGMRLRANGIAPAGTDWKTTYTQDSMQLKIEGSNNYAKRFGGISFSTRVDGTTGAHFTYGIDMRKAKFQDNNAINLANDHKIYWGELSGGPTKWIGYEDSTKCMNFRNTPISINSVKVLGPKVGGINSLTGSSSGSSYNTATITTQELAMYVKKVVDALIGHGMIGPDTDVTEQIKEFDWVQH